MSFHRGHPNCVFITKTEPRKVSFSAKKDRTPPDSAVFFCGVQNPFFVVFYNSCQPQLWQLLQILTKRHANSFHSIGSSARANFRHCIAAGSI
jgi:hypothetical protein